MPDDTKTDSERELELREREIAIKKRWTNLFIVALVIAAFPALGNAYVAFRTGEAQQRLIAAQVQQILESNKSRPLNARVGLVSKWIDDNGRYIFPTKDQGYEDGCIKPARPSTLAPPTKIDRYGRPSGNYLSPPETSYEARALPYEKAMMPHYVYEVLKPLNVEECKAVAWFDQPGGGVQYKVKDTVETLVSGGYLKDVSAD